MVNAQEIVRTYGRGLALRRQWEREWRDLSALILPRKSNILLGSIPGRMQTFRLMDSTAIKANEDLASAMQGSLTSSAIRWFSLKMREKELNDQKEVAVWLEEVADRLHLALQQANFAAEMHEGYLDLGAFGICAILVEEMPIERAGFNGFLFRAYTIGEYVIEENSLGRVDTLYRKMNLSARAAAEKFGMANLSQRARESAEKKPDEMYSFLHAVFPRTHFAEGLVESKRKRWASIYIELGRQSPGSEASSSNQHVVEEGGYDQFPYLVPRWTKVSDDIYGRGVGHTALPDVKSLNRAQELTFKQWAKAIDPAVEVLDGAVDGTVNLTPAATNYVQTSGAIKPIESGAKFDVNQVESEKLRMRVRGMFFADQLNLPPMQGTPASATEIRVRFELMERLLGPTLGRLESELLNPLIDRCFQLMLRAGALPPVPSAVLEATQKGTGQVDVEYEGPLARSQKTSDLDAIQRTVAVVAPIVEVFPDIMDNFDSDKLARHVASVTGLPASLLRDVKEVVALRGARAQEAEERAQMEQAEAAAKITQASSAGAKNLAQAGAQGGGQAGAAAPSV